MLLLLLFYFIPFYYSVRWELFHYLQCLNFRVTCYILETEVQKEERGSIITINETKRKKERNNKMK